MLYWSLVFLVLALIAGAFGLSGVAGTSAWMAQVLFVGFLVVAALSFFARHAPKSA